MEMNEKKGNIEILDAKLVSNKERKLVEEAKKIIKKNKSVEEWDIGEVTIYDEDGIIKDFVNTIQKTCSECERERIRLNKSCFRDGTLYENNRIREDVLKLRVSDIIFNKESVFRDDVLKILKGCDE